MISIQTEKVITAAEVGNHCPVRRAGKKIHSSTVIRWWKRGCKAEDGSRVYLEMIRVGGTLCTSVEALQRFFDRLSDSTGGGSEVNHGPDSPSRWPTTAYNQRQDRIARELVNQWGV